MAFNCYLTFLEYNWRLPDTVPARYYMEPSKNRPCHNSAINLDPMNLMNLMKQRDETMWDPNCFSHVSKQTPGFAPKL